MSIRYQNSEEQFQEAQKYIPMAAQTFSKSYNSYPVGISPLFATHGKGSKLYDVDGNEYIDFTMGLCSTVLGYADNDVNNAVKEQLDKGSIFSLSSPLELEVAKKIIDLIPCAEMVRFGKNGGDVTKGAIRLARAYTRKDYIIKCRGHYHGSESFNLGNINPLGEPEAITDLTLLADYNDIDSFKDLFDCYEVDGIAAVIIEPMNICYPNLGFFDELTKLCHDNGALLILDEIITWPRFGIHGAQDLFGIKPDLCTIGKGLANGLPLSALVGKKEIMQLLDKVHFSFTFGGDLISLAAANIVLDKIKDGSIIKLINEKGAYLKLNFKDRYRDFVELLDTQLSWTQLKFKDCNGYQAHEIKTLWQQEIYKRGILCIGYHAISASHTYEDINRLLEVYEEVFEIIKKAIDNKQLYQYLEIEPNKPKMKIR